MIFEKLKSGIEVEDEEFDAMYPKRLINKSKIHFTPVKVAQVAAQFLAEKPGARILDIGSGTGKFCMVGAACTTAHFVGVEQRKTLHSVAKKLSKRYGLPRVEFVLSNIVALDFSAFDGIYYFNAFYENVSQNDPIDNSVILDKALYPIYNQYVREQLSKMPAGTRLATYFSFMDEIPASYQIQSTDFDGKLKLWEKVI